MSDVFDLHTAVEEDVLGPYRATVDPGMTGFKGAHGGYLMALALRAMSGAVGDPTRVPRTLSAYLLAPVGAGPLELHTRVDRAGGSMTTASTRLEQDRAPGALAIASFGRAADSIAHTDRVMPQVAPPEELEPLFAKPVPEADAGLHVEHRPAGPLPLAGGDEAEILVWMRLAERRPVDAFVATFLADSGPPALYGAMSDFVAMPSTDITLHFSGAPRAPRGEWVLGVFRNRLAAEGYAVEDGELWTPEGELVVQSRQRRRIFG
jgi:acyl-CoA thioesterase